MWAYLKDAVATHPFNFFTLVIALAAGWAFRMGFARVPSRP